MSRIKHRSTYVPFKRNVKEEIGSATLIVSTIVVPALLVVTVTLAIMIVR